MESVDVHLTEHGASLHFFDGRCEDVQKDVLYSSGLMHHMLSDSNGQSNTTFAAPCGVLNKWLLLKSVLASPDAAESVEYDKFIEYLQVANFMADATAVDKLSFLLASQLFESKRRSPVPDTQAANPKALGNLPDDLATEVLQTAMRSELAARHDVFALMPGPLDVAVLQATFPEFFRSKALEIDSLKHPITASSACLANLARFRNAQHLTINLAAHKRLDATVSVRHCQSLESALSHAARHNMPVNLHMEVTCRKSLKHLLKYTIAGATVIRKITLCDTEAATTSHCSPSRGFWDSIQPGCYPGLQRLSILHSPTTMDLRSQLDLHKFRMTSSIASFTGLTQLYIQENMHATQPAVFLKALSQLRDLDACFAVYDEKELCELQSAVSGLSQLTRLALGDTRNRVMHRLLYHYDAMQQHIQLPSSHIRALYVAASAAANDGHARIRASSIGTVRFMNLQLPSSAPLQHLDLSMCCLSDDLMVALMFQLQAMASGKAQSTLQYFAISVLQPGAATMDLLRILKTFPHLNEIYLQSELPYQGDGELEGIICSLTSLQKLSLYDVYTMKSIHTHPPLLTVLTGLSTLVLKDSGLYGAWQMRNPRDMSDLAFFQGLEKLTQLHTLSLSSLPLSNSAAIGAFSSSLHSLQRLSSLELHFNAHIMQSMHLLGEGLAGLRQLTHLQLHQTYRGYVFVMHQLSLALHEMSCLASLSIHGMLLRAQCCSSLGQALACTALSGLQSLDVQRCRFQFSGYESLVQALESHLPARFTTDSTDRTPAHLGLTQLTWSSSLGRTDSVHLARVISLFPNLQRCNLHDFNGPIKYQVEGIQNALRDLKTLQHLDLKSSLPWSPEQLECLCTLLASNPQLHTIDTGHTSSMQIWRDGPSGWKSMNKVEELLQSDKDPMRCLNLQATAGAYNDFWRTAIRLSVAGLGVLLVGACVHLYRRREAQVKPKHQESGPQRATDASAEFGSKVGGTPSRLINRAASITAILRTRGDVFCVWPQHP